MADTGIREKVVAFEKESTRLTLETAANWIAPESSTEFQVDRVLLEDNGTRDIKEKFPSVVGPKAVSGSIVNLPVEQDANLGDLLFAVLGGQGASPGSLGDGGYSHVFTPATVIIPPTYSFHVDRGAVLGVKGYNGCLIKKMTLNQEQGERLMMNAEIIGLNEATGNVGSPSFSDPDPFTFDHISSIALATVDNKANIVSFSINIDNQAKLKTPINGVVTPSDINCVDGVLVDGTFNTYMVNETERDKYVAGSVSDLVITYIGKVIGGAITYKITIDIHKIEYQAYPFGDINGMFGASVAFNAVYSTGDSQTITVTIQNAQSGSY